ncbi:MAG: response regulator transcription factor [Mucilaginibacter sp.]|nr:response regulator transcription factor [Mucilaginibacter sp.]
MRYRCLVADDNLIDRDLIVKYLSKIDSLHLVAVCDDGFEAAKVLATEQIDVLFSDIDMPNLSGLSLVRSLKHPPVIIFITSHVEYAIEGFNLDVIDFIVKPLTFERFYKAVNKAVEYLELKKAFNDKIDNSEELFQVDKSIQAKYFFIKENNALTRISYDDVFYIESLGDYSTVFTAAGKHVTLVNLKKMEKHLPGGIFKRIHKQYIVNLNHIITIGSNEVKLSNSQVIPISAVARQDVYDLIVSHTMLARSAD